LVDVALLASRHRPLLALQMACRLRSTTVVLGGVVLLIDHNAHLVVPNQLQMHSRSKSTVEMPLHHRNSLRGRSFIRVLKSSEPKSVHRRLVP
jgi:hypothetical protein